MIPRPGLSTPLAAAQYLGSGGVIQDNHVSGLVTTGVGTAGGIAAFAGNTRVQGNHVTAQSTTAGIGIYASGLGTFCLQNTVAHYTTPLQECEQSAGNLAWPAP